MSCCNNSTRCSMCKNYPNCSWYTCPGYRYSVMPIIRNPVTNVERRGVAYLSSTAATIATGGTIPLVLSNIVGGGNNISYGTNNLVLQRGLYLINYSLTGQGSDGISAGVTLNGVAIPQLTQSSATASTNQNISASGIINVTEPNSILALVNNSGDSITLINANLLVRELN